MATIKVASHSGDFERIVFTHPLDMYHKRLATQAPATFCAMTRHHTFVTYGASIHSNQSGQFLVAYPTQLFRRMQFLKRENVENNSQQHTANQSISDSMPPRTQRMTSTGVHVQVEYALPDAAILVIPQQGMNTHAEVVLCLTACSIHILRVESTWQVGSKDHEIASSIHPITTFNAQDHHAMDTSTTFHPHRFYTTCWRGQDPHRFYLVTSPPSLEDALPHTIAHLSEFTWSQNGFELQRQAPILYSNESELNHALLQSDTQGVLDSLICDTWLGKRLALVSPIISSSPTFSNLLCILDIKRYLANPKRMSFHGPSGFDTNQIIRVIPSSITKAPPLEVKFNPSGGAVAISFHDGTIILTDHLGQLLQMTNAVGHVMPSVQLGTLFRTAHGLRSPHALSWKPHTSNDPSERTPAFAMTWLQDTHGPLCMGRFIAGNANASLSPDYTYNLAAETQFLGPLALLSHVQNTLLPGPAHSPAPGCDVCRRCFVTISSEATEYACNLLMYVYWTASLPLHTAPMAHCLTQLIPFLTDSTVSRTILQFRAHLILSALRASSSSAVSSAHPRIGLLMQLTQVVSELQ